MKGPKRSNSRFSNDIRHSSTKSNTVDDITYTNILRQIFSNISDLGKPVVPCDHGNDGVLFFDGFFWGELAVGVHLSGFFAFFDNYIMTCVFVVVCLAHFEDRAFPRVAFRYVFNKEGICLFFVVRLLV